MSGRRLGSLLVVVALVAALARLVRALRGEPTTTFSNHPTVDGGPAVDRLRATLAPVDSLVALPGDDGVDPPIVPGTLFDPEPVRLAVADPLAEPADALVAPASSSEPVAVAIVATDPAGPVTWAAPVDGGCPDGYPVKAKLKSGIFHLPGMAAYQRTTPDRCYPDAAAAEADGLRPAKR